MKGAISLGHTSINYPLSRPNGPHQEILKASYNPLAVTGLSCALPLIHRYRRCSIYCFQIYIHSSKNIQQGKGGKISLIWRFWPSRRCDPHFRLAELHHYNSPWSFVSWFCHYFWSAVSLADGSQWFSLTVWLYRLEIGFLPLLIIAHMCRGLHADAHSVID